MVLVEVYDRPEGIKPLIVGEFGAVPRIGETISRDAGGYFEYYKVVEVWHRQNWSTNKFVPCVRVELED